jgi:hypothetical protein
MNYNNSNQNMDELRSIQNSVESNDDEFLSDQSNSIEISKHLNEESSNLHNHQRDEFEEKTDHEDNMTKMNDKTHVYFENTTIDSSAFKNFHVFNINSGNIYFMKNSI